MILVDICCLFLSAFESFFFSPSQDLGTSQLTPVMPVRSLTPTLLQSRKRFGTSSASSQSHTYMMSSVESECCSSPRWEKDVEVRTVSSSQYKLQSACSYICTVADLYLVPPVISSVAKPSHRRRSRGCNPC